jgi:hypothetical protein
VIKIWQSGSTVDPPPQHARAVQLELSRQYNEACAPWTLVSHTSARKHSSPHPCSVSDPDMHLRPPSLTRRLLHRLVCVLRISTRHQNFNRNLMTIRRNQQWHPTLHCYGLLFKFSCWQTELDFDELFDWACTCERRRIVRVGRSGWVGMKEMLKGMSSKN